MDGFNEKKWFVYIGDHHEGPHSLAEIQGKLADGSVTSSSYVWSEGMGDWKPMSDVAAFASLLGGPPPSSPPVQAPQLVEAPIEVDAIPATPALEPANREPSVVLTPRSDSSPAHSDLPVEEAHVPITEEPAAPAPHPKKKRSNRRALIWLVFGAIAAGGFHAYSIGILDPVFKNPAVEGALVALQDTLRPIVLPLIPKAPILGQIISPIPKLKDVSPEDLDELRQMAIIDPVGPGPKLGIGLANVSLTAPEFVVSGPLADGTQVEVVVEGISETLLNTMSWSASSKLTFKGRHGQTGPIRSVDSRPVPQGKYYVYVFESEQQSEEAMKALNMISPSTLKINSPLVPQGRRLAQYKIYFLGGTNDASYKERLQEYHTKVTAKAAQEVVNLEQYLQSLSRQAQTTSEKFTALKRPKLTKAQEKSWENFNKDWNNFQSQMDASLQSWTPEVLQNEFFYGMSHQKVVVLAQAIAKLHAVHSAYFANPADLKAAEAQSNEAKAAVDAAVTDLQTRISMIKSTPPGPSGLPKPEAP